MKFILRALAQSYLVRGGRGRVSHPINGHPMPCLSRRGEMTPNESRQWVRFIIASRTLTADQISAQIGLHHDISLKVPARRKNVHEWIAASSLKPDDPLKNHMEYLLARLAPKAKQIEKLLRKHHGLFSVVIASPRPNRPEMWFEKNILHDISALGADIHIDHRWINWPNRWITVKP